MKPCDTCANRGTLWCGGCEHSLPGLEQFDFYQSVRLPECGPLVTQPTKESNTINAE